MDCIAHTGKANLKLVSTILNSDFEPTVFVKKAVEGEGQDASSAEETDGQLAKKKSFFGSVASKLKEAGTSAAQTVAGLTNAVKKLTK